MSEVTLQINVSGSWKNLITFDASRAPEVRKAVSGLSAALGASAKWCFVHDGGRREWLQNSLVEAFSKERTP
ncbi:hypothetical protein [Pinirhizobacter sp.]|jgi:hypothetical protein|uniref:hypothetical protein n=1 Tax=Pinirhizobacter sp. TaxID=2950432 RepID=UPI002F40CE96